MYTLHVPILKFKIIYLHHDVCTLNIRNYYLNYKNVNKSKKLIPI